MIEIKNEFNKKALDLIKNIKNIKKRNVEVGWFDETYPNGKKIGRIMKLLNNGGIVKSKNEIIYIPARPFIENGIKEAISEINKLPIKIRDLIDIKIYEKIGNILIKNIKQAMRELVSPPLSKKTIEIRERKGIYKYGLEKPLMETGTAYKTITKKVE